jgi:hypothetical protein
MSSNQLTNAVTNAAKTHALNKINELGLKDKAIGAAGNVASGYTAGIVNKDDIGRIANLAQNPNKEGLMNAVKSNATVSKALNNPLLQKAAAAKEMAEKTLKDPAVSAALSSVTTAAKPPKGGNYKDKRKSKKGKTKKRKSGKNKRKSKKRII